MQFSLKSVVFIHLFPVLLDVILLPMLFALVMCKLRCMRIGLELQLVLKSVGRNYSGGYIPEVIFNLF